MIWFLSIVGCLLALMILLFITKVKVDITYKHIKDDDLLEVAVHVWWMRVYTFEAPLIKINEESPAIVVEEEESVGGHKTKKDKKITVQTIMHDIHLAERWFRHIIGLNRIIRRFCRHIHLYRFHWYSEIGIGDAATTGSVTGLLWALKGSFYGLIANHVKVHRMPDLSITPHFQGMISRTYFSCMFTFRIGHAIFVGLLIVMHWRRRPKSNTGPSVEQSM
ncbi:DUF2953 domain-containing protein [Bacillus sp. FJAT-45037]|uniref:DUF2953 domain-containing protein n=1 Tax=Bacillus sp. FJAT-45037 TaxID=2011007 RepID=UPI0012FD29F3|nr:DUF2953 domain-containing protein [Bacillus sp. FJAT-45037]